MNLEYLFIAILLAQLFIIHTIYIGKKNYFGISKIKILDISDFIIKLFDANMNSGIRIFKYANESFYIIKRQNESMWWVEITAKELILNRIRFSLKYVEDYQKFISSEYYIKNKSKENASVFLGYKKDVIIPILNELILKMYELDEDGRFYVKYENMRPTNPDFTAVKYHSSTEKHEK